MFCNGAERCTPASSSRDDGCAPPASASPCASGQTCNEAGDRCETACEEGADADGDGVSSVDCDGADCDDADSYRYPGNPEVCDAAGHDEDCNSATLGDTDADSDGYIDGACCNPGASETPICGDDCDDTSAAVSPDDPEVCNSIDDDCDGAVDEGLLQPQYIDADGDGFGSAASDAMTRMGCAAPVGYSPTNDDCDDTAGVGRAINPAAREVCDAAMRDENCNGDRNEGCGCPSVGDSRSCCGARGTQTCLMNATGSAWSDCSVTATAELCNGLDDDCDLTVDEPPPGGSLCPAAGQTCTSGGCACPGAQSVCGSTCQDLTGLCDNGHAGLCRQTGNWACAGDGRTCALTPVVWPGDQLYSGADGRLSHQVGFEGDDGWSPDGSWRTYGYLGGLPSYFQYGPYVELPAGGYRVTFNLSWAGPINAWVDVSRDGGATIASAPLLSSGNGSTAYSLEFGVAGCYTNVEFRIYINSLASGGYLIVTSTRLHRLP